MTTFLGGGMGSQTTRGNVRSGEAQRSIAETQGPDEASMRFVEALRGGDEQAFISVVERHHASMLKVAMSYVSSRAAAEEVVQEAWLAVLKGLHRFEARSSLKTWIFRILINRAKTCAWRESHTLPFSSMEGSAGDSAEPSVDPDRFLDADHPQWPHHWRSPPQDWGESPEERVLSGEAQAYIRRAIEGLPDNQRDVIMLRDIEGWDPAEVCETLTISEANQRVLLHRARSKVRRALEQYFETDSQAYQS